MSKVNIPTFKMNNGLEIPVLGYGTWLGMSEQMPPWLAEDFTMDSPCLNLDRQDHLNGLVYGLPCDTAQYSVCVIEKTAKSSSPSIAVEIVTGYETS